MRSARLFLVPAFAALSLVAQDGSLSGTWSQVRADDIAAAINTTVADMNFIKRPIARGRLTKLNPAYRKVVITISTQEVLIKLDERDAIHMPPDGKSAPWTATSSRWPPRSARISSSRPSRTTRASAPTSSS